MKKKFFARKVLSALVAFVMLLTIMPVGTLVVSASTNSYTYNAESAVAFAESHCSSESQLSKDACDEKWLCAEFVANCLKAGGFNISGYTATVNAKAQGEYMQQFGTKMAGNITGNAINDYDFVLPLKKGDIVYIVYDDTVSASGHVLLCSGEKDSNGNWLFYAHNNRKTKETYALTGKYLEAATEMYAIILEDTGTSKTIVSSAYNAQDFVDAALAKVDTTFDNRYCLRFVAQLFQATYGGSYVSSCCAFHHGNTYIDNTSKENIPLGACVFFSGSTVPCGNTTAGHIGIYVGDGYIVHNWGGKIVKTTIDYVIKSNYSYRGWGWQANIALDSDYVENSTNPDSYPICERDLVYNSSIEKGNDVKWVQCILKHLGYSIDIDGSYGPSSRDTIKKFQSDYGLTVDGQCGPNTRAKLKEVWASKGHTWDSGTVVAAATHTTTGTKEFKCNYCEATKSETIAKLTEHTYSSWEKHDSSLHKKACLCGDTQYANHTWNSETVTKEPTCTDTGVKLLICSGCNAMKTEAISEKGHSYGSWQNYSDTQHKKACSCGDVQYANHTWNGGTTTKVATHTETGVKTYTCTGCNATKTEAIAKLLSHIYGDWVNYDGNQHKRVCACGSYEFSDHSWDNGIITTPATNTTEGTKTYTCSTCNAKKTESVPRIESSDTAAKIIVSNHDVIADGTIKVTISIEENPGVASLILQIAYDNSLLTLTSVEYNSTIGGQTVNPSNLSSPVTLYWINAFENMSDDAVFATLTFKANENSMVGASSNIVISYNADDIYNIDEENISLNIQNGKVTIIDYVPGDINGDGELNNKDVTRLMQYFAGWDVEVNEATLDVNGDGSLNNKDTSRLMQYLAGWDVVIY